MCYRVTRFPGSFIIKLLDLRMFWKKAIILQSRNNKKNSSSYNACASESAMRNCVEKNTERLLRKIRPGGLTEVTNSSYENKQTK